MHIDFKIYEPEIFQLEVDKGTFNPTNIESCQLGPNDYRLVTKAECDLAKDPNSQ